ncbi:MAG: hypothetical protein ABFE07_29095 [Armatimonadia bacterium]
MALEKQALFSGLAGLGVGAAKRVYRKSTKALHGLAVRRQAEFRRGVEVGEGSSAAARRARTADTARAVKHFDLQQRARKAIRYGLIGAGGLAAAGGGAYLAHRILKKKREEQEMGY